MFEKLEEMLPLSSCLLRNSRTRSMCIIAGCMSSKSGLIKEAFDKGERGGVERRCRVRGTAAWALRGRPTS